jgi:hypothetical protein
MPFEPLLNL